MISHHIEVTSLSAMKSRLTPSSVWPLWDWGLKDLSQMTSDHLIQPFTKDEPRVENVVPHSPVSYRLPKHLDLNLPGSSLWYLWAESWQISAIEHQNSLCSPSLWMSPSDNCCPTCTYVSRGTQTPWLTPAQMFSLASMVWGSLFWQITSDHLMQSFTEDEPNEKCCPTCCSVSEETQGPW